MYWVGALFSKGERARARLWMGQYIDYGYEIPDNLMAVLLGLTFCVISPLIAPVALLFFIVNNIVGRCQLVYVYAERFQSGGKVRCCPSCCVPSNLAWAHSPICIKQALGLEKMSKDCLCSTIGAVCFW